MGIWAGRRELGTLSHGTALTRPSASAAAAVAEAAALAVRGSELSHGRLALRPLSSQLMDGSPGDLACCAEMGYCGAALSRCCYLRPRQTCCSQTCCK